MTPCLTGIDLPLRGRMWDEYLGITSFVSVPGGPGRRRGADDVGARRPTTRKERETVRTGTVKEVT